MAACLDLRGPVPAEAELLRCFQERRQALANLTPNGVLMPKREFTLEFNLLNRAVATVLSEFLPDDLVASIQSLIRYRIVDGAVDARRDQRPYATNKLHSDVWAGDPVDSVTLIIPVLGDPRNIGVEFFEMPRGLEWSYMRPLADYDLGAGIEPLVPYEGLNFDVGSAYFFDSRLLHRTQRKAPGLRVSLDVRFRRKLPPEDRTWLGELADKDNDINPSIDYQLWKGLGTDLLVVIPETCAEARARFTGKGNTAPALPQLVQLFSGLGMSASPASL
jgi:hypothetical protein